MPEYDVRSQRSEAMMPVFVARAFVLGHGQVAGWGMIPKERLSQMYQSWEIRKR